MMGKRVVFLVLAIFIVVVVMELAGRYYGLRDYPTYQADEDFEYIHEPNQTRRIYRNHFATNEFSMRSAPLTESDGPVVLLIGDSVVNGGNPTDQDDLASSILEARLKEELVPGVRVLNISAGSWGPDNAMEYIKKYGDFGADAIILVLSSHDVHDVMTFKEVVGVHPQFPDENARFALAKLFERGGQVINSRLLRKSVKKREQADQELGISREEVFNPGIQYFYEFTMSQDIPFLIYHHLSEQEMELSKLSEEGVLLKDFCNNNQIEYISEADLPISKDHLRDNIHYSVEGQYFLAMNVYNWLYDTLQYVESDN